MIFKYNLWFSVICLICTCLDMLANSDLHQAFRFLVTRMIRFIFYVHLDLVLVLLVWIENITNYDIYKKPTGLREVFLIEQNFHISSNFCFCLFSPQICYIFILWPSNPPIVVRGEWGDHLSDVRHWCARVGACQCNLICILYSSSSERRYQGTRNYKRRQLYGYIGAIL